MINVLVTILIGVLGWQLAKYSKLPAPGILGSMILVGITNLIFSYADYTTFMKVFGVAMSGAYIGVQVEKEDLINFKYMVKPFMILAFMLTINTFVIGSIIHYLYHIDWTTALLSCVAGGATDISIIAMDLNADVSFVTMMQTLRLIGTLIIFPYWILWVSKNEKEIVANNLETSIKQSKKLYLNSEKKKQVFTLMIVLISGFIGLWTKIPAGTMTLPMFIIMILNITTETVYISKNEKILAQILQGSILGCSIQTSIFSSLDKIIFPIIILLLSYFIINYIFSILCKKLNMIDLKSAMFASAPGGTTDMALIAADLGADLTKIALIQTFRAIYVICVMPTLIILFVNFI